MRTIDYDDVPDRPWANGGGTTREVHRDERWRLSIATIAAAGPFSTFPGVVRWFTVARGSLDLDVSGSRQHLVAGDDLVFGGDAPVVAHPDGEVTAVNVMATLPTGLRVAGPYSGGPAAAVVDLDTLQTHLDVSPGDLPTLERAVVVLKEIS